MPKIEVNTTEERYQGLVSEGVYPSVCADIEVVDVKSSQDGRKQLKWSFESIWVNPEGAEKAVEFVRFTPLSGKGVSFTREVLVALDVPFSDGATSISFDTDDVKGRNVLLTVKNTTREGRSQNEITGYAKLT